MLKWQAAQRIAIVWVTATDQYAWITGAHPDVQQEEAVLKTVIAHGWKDVRGTSVLDVNINRIEEMNIILIEIW